MPNIDVEEWVQVVNTWTVESTATDDEGTAAENSMMIKTAKPRDANISRLQLVVKLDYKILSLDCKLYEI